MSSLSDLNSLLRDPLKMPDGSTYGDHLDRESKRLERIERARRADLALAGFDEWIMREMGKSSTAALKSKRLAWEAWELTGGDPASLFEGDWALDAAFSTYTSMRGACTRLANWIMSAAKTDRDIDWARDQLRRIANTAGRRPLANRPLKDLYPRGSRTRTVKIRVATQEDVEALLDGVDKACSTRYRGIPWARDVLRLGYLAGLSAPEIVGIKRQDIELALSRKSKKPWIPVWKRHNNGPSRMRRRAVPLVLVLGEAKRLVAWPYPWDCLADMIHPVAVSPVKRLDGSRFKIDKMRQYVMELAFGDALPEERGAAAYSKCLAWWVAGELYRQHRDWIMVSQFLGTGLSECKKHAYLRDIEYETATGQVRKDSLMEGLPRGILGNR